jgi:DNA-binding response OmpR family regulator
VTARATVLIADDDEDVRRLVATALRVGFADVLEAADGAEALYFARHERPHAAVLDVRMPRASGLEVARALRSRPETTAIPILMLTAVAGRDDVLAAIEAGASAYIAKPFHLRELRDRLRAALDR